MRCLSTEQAGFSNAKLVSATCTWLGSKTLPRRSVVMNARWGSGRREEKKREEMRAKAAVRHDRPVVEGVKPECPRKGNLCLLGDRDKPPCSVTDHVVTIV